ncbi:hypothetical protein, partial [Agrococcus sp. HG114]|uniref:hypothetical protein n=1 Tax=Agrococcus sp. HG114 TaxID=2969757 RepID=UPI00215A5074
AQHRLGADAWAPSLRVPIAGGVVAAMGEPEVGLPVLAGVGLLIAVALVGQRPRRVGSPLVVSGAGSVRS